VLSQIAGTDALLDLMLDNVQLDEIDVLNFPIESFKRDVFWEQLTSPLKGAGGYPAQLQHILSTLLPEKRGNYEPDETSLRQGLALRGVEYEKLYGVKLEDICVIDDYEK